MADIKLTDVVKKFGQTVAVHGIELDIKHNEFVVLVGPSGCGKSTTLRMIAGLEDISEGTITIGSDVVNDLPPRKRNISMVFQNYALYPHMSVRENLGFSLKIAKMPESQVTERVGEAAEMLGLMELMERTPSELSGGQRQRVAMGRAIVRHPEAFLFDEPLSNLDAKLRVQMRTEIKKLHQRVEATVVYVTHDQVEAMTLADRIVVMRNGRIEQVGTPMDVFNNPVNTFVAGFIGSPPMNMIEAAISRNQIVINNEYSLPVPKRFEKSITEGRKVILGIRADDLTPEGHGISSSTGNANLDLTVELAEPLGTETILYTEIEEKEILCKMFNPRIVKPGEKLKFNVTLDNVHLFDAESHNALETE